MRDFCSTEDGVLHFQVPTGQSTPSPSMRLAIRCRYCNNFGYVPRGRYKHESAGPKSGAFLFFPALEPLGWNIVSLNHPPATATRVRFGNIASRIGILLVLAATYFVYAPVTAFSFVYDDIFQIVQNPRIDSWSLLPGYFTQHFWAHVPGTPANLYRPLVLVWFLINNSIFSHEPSGGT